MFKRIYWAFSYLGVMTFAAAFLMGFRHSSGASFANLVFDLLLYAVFIGVHIVMTTPAFKQSAFGRAEGTPSERRIFVAIAVVTWVGVYWLHRPLGGFAFSSPAWLQYVGICAVLLSVVAFFEFATFESLGQLLGMPGAELSHSVGAETPLMTEGPYASVRHPMYRAAVWITFASLLVHPNASQLFFAILTSVSFLGFIPYEERQLVAARGDEYRAYMRKTPYRVFHGVW